MNSVAVVGAGAWGTALAIQAARAGNEVTLVARDPSRIRNGINPRLPGVAIPGEIAVSDRAPGDAAFVVVAVPTAALPSVLPDLAGAPALLACKGLDPVTGRLPLETAAALRPDLSAVLLTGPNFAGEVAAGLPAASVIAGADARARAHAIAVLGTPAFRLYGNADATGAALGGAAKNVIAIAAGCVIGAGLGENARAALITRGVAELARLVAALGGRAETAHGLSGLGDLLLTCGSAQSRNFSYGLALGRGEVPRAGATVEGVATAPALVARTGGVDLPICRAVVSVLRAELGVAEAIACLLGRPLRDE